MPDIFDIYLIEALINGVLLGGVLALLALGLNLIFGVIDVVWTCYAELIMLGMYGMFYMVSVYHLPFLLAAVLAVPGAVLSHRDAAGLHGLRPATCPLPQGERTKKDTTWNS